MENLFKQRLGANAPLVGTWLMSASATCAEAVGWTGLGFVVVDMEHVPLDVHDVVDILRALAPTATGTITRVPSNDPVMVKRVLDCGAQTIMFPMIQGPEEAALAVGATRYPPAGIRGVAAMHRASRYGAVSDYLHKCQDELCIVVQVETPRAYGRLAEIAAVDGVDAVFIGPADLAANAGHLGNSLHPDVQRLIADAPPTIHAQGKRAGILVPNPDLARRCVDNGYDFVAIGSDVSAMTAAMRSHVAGWSS
jgi:4-hydroxy-2-oxoheptanedioate aldolase